MMVPAILFTRLVRGSWRRFYIGRYLAPLSFRFFLSRLCAADRGPSCSDRSDSPSGLANRCICAADQPCM